MFLWNWNSLFLQELLSLLPWCHIGAILADGNPG